MAEPLHPHPSVAPRVPQRFMQETFYQAPSSGFDEMLTRKGEVRDHWRTVHQTLARIGFDSIDEHGKIAYRLLRDDGANFNIHGDPAGLNRTWELDVIPLIIDHEEWKSIDKAIIQRAHLFDLILADIYGEQRLIREGVVPPELIFGHPGFARPWVGIRLPGRHQLVLYAVDLARDAQGRFQVMGDRTQIPTGAGYALENRSVTNRVFPDLFRESRVIRLSHFFSTLRNTLMGLAANGRSDPRVVLLSPGSHNETYFEQGFLARYLGISIVEGRDLYVRQGRVWLRTLWGEETVDVIFRRVDDDYSDPLEFRGESLLGVAGLTEVARRGNVSIVNPLGSGVLENPGLYSFLPRIARFFGVGELRLPQVETWWCGDSQNLAYVLNNLKNLIIKPIYRKPGIRPVRGDRLSESEFDMWRQRIRTKPEAWVAQSYTTISTVPCHNGPHLTPCNMLLRGYAIADESSDYVVMGGGLTRVGTSAESDHISLQMGSRSKDTWVLSSDDDTKVSLWLHPQHKLADSAPELLVSGRAAENLFWLGRYVERTDAVIGLLQLVAAFMSADSKNMLTQIPENARLLLPVLTHFTYTYPGFTTAESSKDYNLRNAELASLFSDSYRSGSVAFNLSSMICASSEVHDLLSYEIRRTVTRIEGKAQSLASRSHVSIEKLLPALANLKNDMLALNCLIDQSMIRGLAWRFLDLGKRIERALSLVRLQQFTIAASQSERLDQELLRILLFTTDNDVNYQQRYGTGLLADRVLDLLLMEENNPCSVMYQMLQINQHLDHLRNRGHSHILNREERLIVEATTRLRLADSWELSKRDAQTAFRAPLDRLLNELHQALVGSAEALAAHYFTHTTEKQQLLSPIST